MVHIGGPLPGTGLPLVEWNHRVVALGKIEQRFTPNYKIQNVTNSIYIVYYNQSCMQTSVNLSASYQTLFLALIANQFQFDTFDTSEHPRQRRMAWAERTPLCRSDEAASVGGQRPMSKQKASLIGTYRVLHFKCEKKVRWPKKGATWYVPAHYRSILPPALIIEVAGWQELRKRPRYKVH